MALLNIRPFQNVNVCSFNKTYVVPLRVHFLPLQKKGLCWRPLVVEAKMRKRANTRTDNAKILNRRFRKKYNGTPSKPRLSVFCSDKQLYAMLVDDENKKCLFYGSTLQKSFRIDPDMSTATEDFYLRKWKRHSSAQLIFHGDFGEVFGLNSELADGISWEEIAKAVGEELVKAAVKLDINEISSYDRNGFAVGERISAFEIAISEHGFLLR